MLASDVAHRCLAAETIEFGSRSGRRHTRACSRPARVYSPLVLTPEQRRQWDEYGFLVLPTFLDDAELAMLQAAWDRVWLESPPDVTVDAESTRRRIALRYVTEEERRGSFKINDLYLRDAQLRQVVLSARLGRLLTDLLADEPVIINTLSLENGSQQADHLDTLFMTPWSEHGLVATWVALEDVQPDAGPLRYYPESNHIEPYRFVDPGPGGLHLHVDNREMPQWTDYMASAVDRRGLSEERFLGKRGDVFIWSAYLLHGGCVIDAPGTSRRSLVTHYLPRADCVRMGADLRPVEGGWWMRRSPQPQPDNPQNVETEAVTTAAPLWDRLQHLLVRSGQ
jgi:phytanoyl-CoA hydroxylase